MTALRFQAFPIVLAAPSGTGKTTLARALVTLGEGYTFSISATTRPPRPRELDGVDYHFVTDEAFQTMVEREELAEWAEVHGHRYGTPRSELSRAAAEGQYVILDIDVQGARQIRETVPEAVQVFILPPSAEALISRLDRRGSDAAEEVRRRMAVALEELGEAPRFDYIVVNKDVSETVTTIRGIVDAERHRVARAADLKDELERLRSGLERILEGGERRTSPESAEMEQAT